MRRCGAGRLLRDGVCDGPCVPAPRAAAGSDTLAALGATATALSAAFRGVEGGAAEGAEALVAAVAAAAQQVGGTRKPGRQGAGC